MEAYGGDHDRTGQDMWTSGRRLHRRSYRHDLNFHVHYCYELYQQQPRNQSDSADNSLDYPPLEGFVLAISPFDFAALGAHIAFTPAILGNVVLWKPSPMAVLSNYILYEIMEEAGMPKALSSSCPWRTRRSW